MFVIKAIKMIKVTSALPLVLMATQTHLSNFPSNNMEEVCYCLHPRYFLNHSWHTWWSPIQLLTRSNSA